ncbi:MAG: 3-deoxy-7-phosphoheptulonate synthase, partial [Candidatus Micrarchaeaceae archaeon]
MPNNISSTAELAPTFAPEQIVAMLPNDPYEVTRQPQYPYTPALTQALREVQRIGPLITQDEIRAHCELMGRLALGKESTPLIISGRCAAPVYESVYDAATTEAYELRAAAALGLDDAIHEIRYANQNAKPRTIEWEISDGQRIPAFMGENINGTPITERTPDPRRMVFAAAQASAIHASNAKDPLLHAHEALLLPYELAQMYGSHETGTQYLASSHHVWAGERTRDPSGAHIQLLGSIRNAVGVKLGPTTTAADIIQLEQVLNP